MHCFLSIALQPALGVPLYGNLNECKLIRIYFYVIIHMFKNSSAISYIPALFIFLIANANSQYVFQCDF